MASADTEWGLALGAHRSRILVAREDTRDTRNGWRVGAYVLAPTPLGLRVQGEAALVQRGGRARLPGGSGALEADYLSMSVLPRWDLSAGPVTLFVYAGPSVEVHLRTRAAAELAEVYRQANTQVLGLELGTGLAVGLGGGQRISVELRLSEGLVSAFADPAPETRLRSLGFVVRASRPAG